MMLLATQLWLKRTSQIILPPFFPTPSSLEGKLRPKKVGGAEIVVVVPSIQPPRRRKLDKMGLMKLFGREHERERGKMLSEKNWVSSGVGKPAQL